MSGDIDAHVAVLAEDLRGAYRYGEIVAVLRAAGRDDDAEQWARKGLAEHASGFQTDRLRDQLVDLLLDGGAGAEAVAVRREIYVIRPYQDLIEIGLDRASDKYRYPKAVKTIRRLRDSYHRAGDAAGFTAYVADLRQPHRRKTSFIAKLDQALVRR